MTEALFSPSWYRVAGLKPRLRGHARIHRQSYRGEPWHVLQDQATGRFFRFTPAFHHVIALMDGRRSVQDIWERVSERFGDDAPNQGEMVRLLGQLHAADVLVCDVPPDTEELLKRWKKTEHSRLKMNLRSPMALSFPLLDPEKFLNRTVRFVRPLFSAPAAIAWAAVVGAAFVLAGMHWPELTQNVADRILTAENLVSMSLAYPILKALHEFGHGYAVKAWGGEVHEMGIMFLVLMPIPYVDASAATAFPEKRRRIVVGATGMMVDLFLASAALFLWLLLSPGRLHSLLYNVIFIASVSTIVFNANPLLRYDGYYMLSDWLEIPNLSQRSLEYLGYFFKRRVFGIKEAEAPYAGPGGRFWFAVYAVSSFVYRAFLYAAIILFIAGKFFIAGVLLAAWAFASMVIVPGAKRLHFVAASPVLRNRRGRAVVATAAMLAAVAILLFLVPVPARTRAEGIVWVPEEALVRAGTDCFIARVATPPNTAVEKGAVLLECHDPLTQAEVKVLEARIQELEAKYRGALPTDRVQARIVREEIESARGQLGRARERQRELAIRSPADGIFVLPNSADLPDRFLRQGDLVGYVLDVQKPTVRAVVTQSDVDLVRNRTRGVAVRLVERLEEVVPATLRREVPGALSRLPSTILGASGGGRIAVDPREEGGVKAMESLFQFDVELDRPVDGIFVGGRVHVRFDHGLEPLGFQWHRTIRQMVLRRFHV